jgi:hypothetical protein
MQILFRQQGDLVEMAWKRPGFSISSCLHARRNQELDSAARCALGPRDSQLAASETGHCYPSACDAAALAAFDMLEGQDLTMEQASAVFHSNGLDVLLGWSVSGRWRFSFWQTERRILQGAMARKLAWRSGWLLACPH